MFKKLVILIVTIFIVAGCKQKQPAVTPPDVIIPAGSITIAPTETTDMVSSAISLTFNVSLDGVTLPLYQLMVSDNNIVEQGSISPDNTMFMLFPLSGVKKGQTVDIYVIDGSTPAIRSNSITLIAANDIR